MSFKQKRILMKTFVESQFQVILVYGFQTKADPYKDIAWASVWSFLSLWVSNKSKSLWRYFLRLSSKLCEFMSVKQRRIVMKTFVDSQFEVFYVYEFQSKANSHEDICRNSVSSLVSLWLWNKSEFLWRHLVSLSFKLFKFRSFKENLLLIRTFVEPQFEIL